VKSIFELAHAIQLTEKYGIFVHKTLFGDLQKSMMNNFMFFNTRINIGHGLPRQAMVEITQRYVAAKNYW